MRATKHKKQIALSGFFLLFFHYLPAISLKPDSTDCFQLFFNSELIVEGKVELAKMYVYGQNRTTAVLSKCPKHIVVHATDTLTFIFKNGAENLALVPYLTLQDSSLHNIGSFFNEGANGKMHYYSWPAHIRLYGNSLIAWMKARKTKKELFHFYYAQKISQPISHTVEKDGSHVYRSEPDPPGQVLFGFTVEWLE